MQSRAGKEGEPLAPGSIPHSTARAPWQWSPATHQHPPNWASRGRDPLFSWGLNPKFLLHWVCTEGPFQHLNLHGQGLPGPCLHPRLSRAELSCWRGTSGAAPLPTDGADGGHRLAPRAQVCGAGAACASGCCGRWKWMWIACAACWDRTGAWPQPPFPADGLGSRLGAQRMAGWAQTTAEAQVRQFTHMDVFVKALGSEHHSQGCSV